MVRAEGLKGITVVTFNDACIRLMFEGGKMLGFMGICKEGIRKT